MYAPVEVEAFESESTRAIAGRRRGHSLTLSLFVLNSALQEEVIENAQLEPKNLILLAGDKLFGCLYTISEG